MGFVEAAANELRNQVGAVSLPVNPFEIAASLGIIVEQNDATGFLGSLFRVGSLCSISINRNILEEGRKNFTLGHELGHFKLHVDLPTFNCKKSDLNPFTNETPRPEQEANEFASFLLLPSDLIRPYFSVEEPTFREMQALAGKANTTITATVLRFVTFGAIPCALVLAKKGQIRWFRKTEDFPFQIMMGPVMPRTLSYAFFKAGKIPPKHEAWDVPVECWCENGRTRDSTLQEACLAMPTYDTTLSLLYPSSTSEDVLDDDDRETVWEEPTFRRK